ncbi:type II toxin-antitoxin system Phd/YefM family antitoxin [Moorella naiadis]|uniref:type II toxin-antitoxin system Phd/YefM family antitoxin n=1 Tax=Moorella naiadis (nom. illeg.) TaxID=3093670 RepID=UPI003D9CA684
MEEILGVEEARRKLGRLVTKVAQNREPVIIIHKAKEKAVLLSYEEYKQLQNISAANAKQTVIQALQNIQEAVKKENLEQDVIEAAIHEVRSR